MSMPTLEPTGIPPAVALSSEEPLLRTLAPALRRLAAGLRGWLTSQHCYPRTVLIQATLEGMANDLARQGEALDVDRPLLVIMLMGGTGVGKSTLLNALAGAPIAQASFTRPTTRDPVVYYHHSLRPEQLDPMMRHCRLVAHDREPLRHKVLVDTPDLDSNDLSNRDTLSRLLPIADVVLYVGSQEKYHDQLGWELFVHQRQRRAFAFVLNKWDRCLHAFTSGVRPDDDLLRDLHAEGFQQPVLFRVCAQHWLDAQTSPAINGQTNGTGLPQAPQGLPEGEQFPDLVQWLEHGLTRLEIEAIKARGVGQLLAQLEQTLQIASPPDMSTMARRIHSGWERLLADEAAATAEVLLTTLEPYQREIEHHFTVEGQKRFRGWMALYLNTFTRVKYAGNSLRDRLPLMPRTVTKVTLPDAWDLATFTSACSGAAAERQLDARGRALGNRLLVEADQLGFPLALLTEPVEAASTADWRKRHAQILIEVLQHVEQQWSRPTGMRRVVQGVIAFLADWSPSITLLAGISLVLWKYFMVTGYKAELQDFLLPLVATLGVLIVLHLLITLLLPLRWPSIRGEFRRELERRLSRELAEVYGDIPDRVAQALLDERRRVEVLRHELGTVATWLHEREKAASISALYGSEPVAK